MKRIALFGASGRTGQPFLKRALEKGYFVKALVRNPGNIPQRDQKLEIITGDVLDPEKVSETVRGTDLVVSLIGHVKGSPKWVQTDGIKHMVEAMEEHGLKKIISLSGGAVPFEKDQPGLMDRFFRGFMRLFLPKVLEDAEAHAEVLRNSDTDWIIVRGPRLTNGARKGKYWVGWVGEGGSTSISRADLADFILQQVETDHYLHQMPFVTHE